MILNSKEMKRNEKDKEGTEISESPLGKVEKPCELRSSLLCLVKLQNQRAPSHNSCTNIQQLQASTLQNPNHALP